MDTKRLHMPQHRYALNKSKYLLDHETEKLESLLKSHLLQDKRNCVLLFLALYTGARATELLNLRPQDLDESDQVVFIKGIKGSEDREIPLPQWLFRELKSLKGNDQKIFPISYNRLRQIWEIYRPTHKKFHSLRHTFAIRLYRKTKDLRLVQMALGHRNITNTMIYSQYLYSKKELKKLIL